MYNNRSDRNGLRSVTHSANFCFSWRNYVHARSSHGQALQGRNIFLGVFVCVCVCVCASVLRVGVLLLYAQHRVAM